MKLSRWRPYKVVLLVVVALASCRSSKEKQSATIPADKPPENINERQPRPRQLGLVDLSSEPETWEKVISAFNAELQPDPSGKDTGGEAYLFKRIARAWRSGDAVLVIVEKRPRKEAEWWERLFQVYNYNLANAEKSEITAKWSFWLWKFREFANFDNGPTPDITFESATCTECEPIIVLSSLYLDPNSGSWKLRRWADGDEGIGIYDTGANEDGADPEYAALSGIADFQGKGVEQVAVWTRYREVDEKNPEKVLPVVSELILYGFQNEMPFKTTIRKKTEVDRIKKFLSAPQLGQDESKRTD